MSDTQEPSFEEELINRLANRLGIATAQVDAMSLQLERAQKRIEELEAQLPRDTDPMAMPPMTNGFSDEAYQGGVPV
jgi:hypothetical protein